MLKTGKWLLFWVVLLIGRLPINAQTIPLVFDQATNPASLIGSYYNAINVGDYARAYGYWSAPPQNRTEAQFAHGFADTVSAQVLVQLPLNLSAGAGQVYADLPTLVIAQHVDGTTHYYKGCFTVHHSNVPLGNATQPDPRWFINDGTFSEVSTPDLANIQTVCTSPLLLSDADIIPIHDTPITLVQDYFVSLATMTASSNLFWQDPSKDIFAPIYGSMISNARSLDLFVNPLIYMDGAAGSVYATIPSLLMLNTADNRTFYVSACFSARLTTVPQGTMGFIDPNFYLTEGAITTMVDPLTAITEVLTTCKMAG